MCKLKKNCVKPLLSLALTSLCLAGSSTIYAAPYDDNAGLELRRQREEMERERIRQQMEEDKQNRENRVKDERQTENQAPESDVKFLLKNITVDESAIISAAEVEKITKPYIGKEVTLADLNEIVNKLNEIYTAGGYATCKAYIPPQTIENGVVHIALMEGRTGEVNIKGNSHTRESYIRDRLPLKEGEIASLNKLNERLYRFNATNDAPLRISMKAGKAPGTTDYEIVMQEPKNDIFTFFVDNSGSINTGAWREGFYYTNRSLTKRRDNFSASFSRSNGLKSGNFSYAVPMGNEGGKLILDYSSSGNKVTEQSMQDLRMRGHAWSMGASYLQPLITNPTTRTEARFGVSRQHSKTDMQDGAVAWLDNTTDNAYLSFAMTSYGNGNAFYHRHYYGFGHTDAYQANTGNYAGKTFGLYRLNSLYQQSWSNGHQFSGRLDFQWSSTKNLPSSEQFFLGGANSVRGYKPDLFGGDNGLTLGLEYAVPVDRARTVSVFGFFDYGCLIGDTAYNDTDMASLGFGVKASIKRNVYMNLTFGFPLKRDLNDLDVPGSRVHFSMNAQL